MVYIDADELRWMPYVQTWIKTKGKRFTADTAEYIIKLFTTYVDKGLKYAATKCIQPMKQVQ